jgi:hypothetical protein
MAHVQDPANLLQIFYQYPALATLFTGSVLWSVYSHNSLPEPGYGRLLTQAEAHAPVYSNIVNSLPAPNIPPIDVFGHPHTISFSAAPQLTKSPSSSDTFASPMLSTFAYPVPSTDAENVISLSHNLNNMVAVATVIALLAVVFKSFQADNKPVTDHELVRYLRACLAAETAKTANAEARLQVVQDQLVTSQASLKSANSDLNTARNEFSSAYFSLRMALNEVSTLESDIGVLTQENKDRTELNNKHSFRVHEHGLGIYALDAERENSEYDLAVAMHALDARNGENRALVSDIEIALQALNNNHEEQKRQLLCQLDSSQKEFESTLAFHQSTLMCVGQLQTTVEAQAARLSANDGEIGSLRQEQEKVLTEFDLAKQGAVAKDGEIAQLNLDKDDLPKKLHEAEQSDQAKIAVVEDVRLKKTNISAQLDTTSSYLKKAIDEKDVISEQLETAQQANE